MEQWKNIEGYEGHYMISNQGRVKTLKPRSEDILKSRINKHGYNYCSLSLNGKAKQFKVHRLVLQHFTPNPNNKPHVNHLDSNRSNNVAENLEWCTQKENTVHAWKHGHGTLQKARKRRALTQRFSSKVKYKKLQGQQFGSIKILGNITYDRGNVMASTLCMRCGTTKHKNIRAELKGTTRMCLSCKNKSMGRLRRYTH